MLNAEYLKLLKANKSTKDFFGDWCNFLGYCDIGYFLGCEFIKHLAKKYPLDIIANLDTTTIFAEFEAYATIIDC